MTTRPSLAEPCEHGAAEPAAADVLYALDRPAEPVLDGGPAELLPRVDLAHLLQPAAAGLQRQQRGMGIPERGQASAGMGRREPQYYSTAGGAMGMGMAATPGMAAQQQAPGMPPGSVVVAPEQQSIRGGATPTSPMSASGAQMLATAATSSSHAIAVPTQGSISCVSRNARDVASTLRNTHIHEGFSIARTTRTPESARSPTNNALPAQPDHAAVKRSYGTTTGATAAAAWFGRGQYRGHRPSLQAHRLAMLLPAALDFVEPRRGTGGSTRAPVGG